MNATTATDGTAARPQTATEFVLAISALQAGRPSNTTINKLARLAFAKDDAISKLAEATHKTKSHRETLLANARRILQVMLQRTINRRREDAILSDALSALHGAKLATQLRALDAKKQLLLRSCTTLPTIDASPQQLAILEEVARPAMYQWNLVVGQYKIGLRDEELARSTCTAATQEFDMALISVLATIQPETKDGQMLKLLINQASLVYSTSAVRDGAMHMGAIEK